jgi:hypothetical protein
LIGASVESYIYLTEEETIRWCLKNSSSEGKCLYVYAFRDDYGNWERQARFNN